MKRIHLIAAAALAAVAAAGCSRQAPPAKEDIRPVRTTVVGQSDGSVGATYSGEVQARYESKLGFQTNGKIVARFVELGSHVKRGQLLMRLDPAQESLHLAAASADVDAARSRVAQNRIDLQRTEQLLSRQFASQAELEQQRLTLDQAESQLKSALAQQQIKQNQRGYTELLADRDGVVTAIGAEAGQVVGAGQQVVALAGDGEREVLVSVPESRVDELRQAKDLRVTTWSRPGQAYTGELREMAPDTDSLTRTYSARIAVKNPDAALRLGMTASVFAADVEGTRAIRLPLTAIHQTGQAPQVWIVDPQTQQVAPHPVQLGSAQDDSVLVTAGLKGGERVVTAGVHLLYAGQKVKEPAAKPVAAAAKPGAKS